MTARKSDVKNCSYNKCTSEISFMSLLSWAMQGQHLWTSPPFLSTSLLLVNLFPLGVFAIWTPVLFGFRICLLWSNTNNYCKLSIHGMLQFNNKFKKCCLPWCRTHEMVPHKRSILIWDLKNSKAGGTNHHHLFPIVPLCHWPQYLSLRPGAKIVKQETISTFFKPCYIAQLHQHHQLTSSSSGTPMPTWWLPLFCRITPHHRLILLPRDMTVAKIETTQKTENLKEGGSTYLSGFVSPQIPRLH